MLPTFRTIAVLFALGFNYVVSTSLTNVPELNNPQGNPLGILPAGLFPEIVLVSFEDHVYPSSYDKTYANAYQKPYGNAYNNKPYNKPNVEAAYDKSYPKPYDAKLAYETHCTSSLNFCVGFIVNQNFTIIPANCTLLSDGRSRPVTSYRVRVGIDTLNDDELTQSVVYNVKQVFINPDYDPTEGNDNNVAFLELTEPIQYTPYVKEACFDFRTALFELLVGIGYGEIPQLDNNRKYAKYEEQAEQLRSNCKRNSEICVFPLPKTRFGLLSCNSTYGGVFLTPGRDAVGLLAPDPNQHDLCHDRSSIIRLSNYESFFNKIVGEDQWCKVHL